MTLVVAHRAIAAVDYTPLQSAARPSAGARRARTATRRRRAATASSTDVREAVEVEQVTVAPVEQRERRARRRAGRPRRAAAAATRAARCAQVAICTGRGRNDRRRAAISSARPPCRSRFPACSHASQTAGFSSKHRGHAFEQQRRADQQQHGAADEAPLAQQQREEQARRPAAGTRDSAASMSVSAVSGVGARGSAPASGARARRRTSTANSGIAGLICATSHSTSSARPRSPSMPGRKMRWRAARQRVARGLGAHAAIAPASAADQRAERVGDEVDEARVARRREHLQRLQRERQREAGSRTPSATRRARRGAARQRARRTCRAAGR